jgi:hypothetical protein
MGRKALAALVSPPPQVPQDSVTCAATASNGSQPLWSKGTVVFKKGGVGQVLADGTLQMKFFWLLAVDGPLTIEGRRLDGDAPRLRSAMPGGFVGRGFQPSYLLFPTTGCWEVTAKANGSTLTFVTRVVTDGY